MAERRRSNSFAAAIPSGHVLAEVASHAEASDVAARLVAADFPPGDISIIGIDLKLVERIRGRLGYGRIALSGAIAGSWVGMLFAILFGVGISGSNESGTSFDLSQFVAAIVVGIGVGILANVLRFSLSSTKPTYLSSSFPVAQRYQVIVPDERAAEASRLLQE